MTYGDNHWWGTRSVDNRPLVIRYDVTTLYIGLCFGRLLAKEKVFFEFHHYKSYKCYSMTSISETCWLIILDREAATFQLMTPNLFCTIWDIISKSTYWENKVFSILYCILPQHFNVIRFSPTMHIFLSWDKFCY